MNVNPSPYESPADWPAVPASVTKRCDNTSVGVLITGRDGRHLLFTRATPPVGVAPAAGHIDDHGSPEHAARVEVAEELGLTVTTLTTITERWRTNICRRQHGPRGPGHHWTIYRADVIGALNPSSRETRNARWYTTDELQALTERTADHAHELITAASFAAEPGVEPVWVAFLADAGLITVEPGDLIAIDQLANRSPYQHAEPWGA